MPQAAPRGTYLAIADAVRQKVSQEDAPDVLRESSLIEEHGVSRTTIRRALRLLEEEKRIEAVPGVGWHVVKDGISRRPLIDQVLDVIRLDALTEGDEFPSEAALCRRFGETRSRVRRVLAQMEGMGILETTHGKGRTVRTLPNA